MANRETRDRIAAERSDRRVRDVNLTIAELQRGAITYKDFIREIGAMSIELQRQEWEEGHQ
jgi:hypothetical protein